MTSRTAHLSFDGDWLAEVAHPWREIPPVAFSSRSVLPVRRPKAKDIVYLLAVGFALVAVTLFAGSSAPETSVASAPPAVKPALTKVTQAPSHVVPGQALYRRAAVAFGVSWQTLAAIGKLETDHGRAPDSSLESGVNYAGCCAGRMQLCVVSSCGHTFRDYAADGDGDQDPDPYSSADSVFTAASYVSYLQGLFDRPKLVLAAYNAGPGAVQSYDGVPPYEETENYASRGWRIIARLSG